MYETFEHTADLGLRVRAPDLDTLLAEAAAGLFSMIVANLDAVRPVQERSLRVARTRNDDLLFDWLSELLYLFDTKQVLLCEFDVQCTADELTARMRGEPVDRSRHVLDHEVKAITYHGLTCRQTEDGWLAEVVVDI